MTKKCSHSELRRGTEEHASVWYCPEPECDFEIAPEQLRGNLSLAEEGLASAMQENDLLRDQRDTNLAKEVETVRRLEAEIEQLQAECKRLLARGDKAELELNSLKTHYARRAAHEPSASPQAPIARITIVANSGADPFVKFYAPGLPPGEYDLFVEPMSVAPALKSGAAHGD
jgi:hypothetical protein